MYSEKNKNKILEYKLASTTCYPVEWPAQGWDERSSLYARVPDWRGLSHSRGQWTGAESVAGMKEDGRKPALPPVYPAHIALAVTGIWTSSAVVEGERANHYTAEEPTTIWW